MTSLFLAHAVHEDIAAEWLLAYGVRRPVCSVRSRSPPAGVLTVSAIKPTFNSATGAGPSGSYTRYS